MHHGKYGTKTMKVLVTGHKGYIGSTLVPMLLKEGHQVTGLDSDLYRKCTVFPGMGKINEIEKDIRHVEPQDVRGFDAIIHLAGLSNDPLGFLNEEITYDINYRASVRLAKMAKDNGVTKFFFASSCSVYGASDSTFLTEDSPYNPVTPYGWSKLKSEKEISELADYDHFNPVFLRASTVYGTAPRIRFDLVLNNLVAWARITGKILLKSDGKPWRPLVHVEDVAHAYVALLNSEKEKIHNQAFNIGLTTENFQVIDLGSLIEEIGPDYELQWSEKSSPDSRCYRVDCNKIAREIKSFKPQWTVRKGIHQLIKDYSNVNIELTEVEGPKYCRVEHIKMLIQEGKLDDQLMWKQIRAI